MYGNTYGTVNVWKETGMEGNRKEPRKKYLLLYNLVGGTYLSPAKTV